MIKTAAQIAYTTLQKIAAPIMAGLPRQPDIKSPPMVTVDDAPAASPGLMSALDNSLKVRPPQQGLKGGLAANPFTTGAPVAAAAEPNRKHLGGNNLDARMRAQIEQYGAAKARSFKGNEKWKGWAAYDAAHGGGAAPATTPAPEAPAAPKPSAVAALQSTQSKKPWTPTQDQARDLTAVNKAEEEASGNPYWAFNRNNFPTQAEPVNHTAYKGRNLPGDTASNDLFANVRNVPMEVMGTPAERNYR